MFARQCLSCGLLCQNARSRRDERYAFAIAVSVVDDIPVGMIKRHAERLLVAGKCTADPSFTNCRTRMWIGLHAIVIKRRGRECLLIVLVVDSLLVRCIDGIPGSQEGVIITQKRGHTAELMGIVAVASLDLNRTK